MTPGNELRTARERLNLSREEISARTKIQVRKIAALEDDAYEQLPAGIYLDGGAPAVAFERIAAARSVLTITAFASRLLIKCDALSTTKEMCAFSNRPQT